MPNPPAVWIGRAREGAWLEHALATPGVITVAGWSGVGKSALVRHVLRQGARPHAPRRARFVSVVGLDSAAAVRRAVLAALVDAAVGSLPDVTDAALLAAAEDHDHEVVVLDGVGDRALEELATTLQYVADFAVRGSLVLTARARPAVDAGGRLLWLEPLARAELEQLARALDPSAPPETIALALDSARTPRELMEQLGDARHRTGRSHPALEGLDEPARDLLSLLAMAHDPLPLDTLRDAAIDEGAARALVSRRLATIDDDHVELRVEVRDEIATDPARARPPVALTTALAERLGAVGGADVVEAVRLALAVDRADVAARLLAPWTADMLRFDQADALWTLLQRRTEPELATARLRAAVWRDDPSVLASLDPPDASALAARIEWVRLLFAAGRSGEAFPIARDVEARARAAGDTALAFEATYARAHVALHPGGAEEALALLAGAIPADDAQAVRREVLIADAASLGGDHERARKHAVANLVLALAPMDTVLTATTLTRSGDLLRAEAVLDRFAPDLPNRTWHYPRGNLVLLLRVQLALERGHVAEARAFFAGVEATYRPGHAIAPSVELMRVRLALIDGRLDGIAARLRSVAASLEGRAHTTHATPAIATAIEHLAVLTAGVERIDAHLEISGSDGSLWATTHRAVRALREARAGVTSEPSMAAAVRPHPATDTWARIAGATAAIVAGRAGAAVERAIEAGETARGAGYDGLAADALIVAGEAATIAGDDHALATVATLLESLADATASARVRAEAAFFRALSDRSPPRAPPGSHPSLATYRRCAALAGLEVALDAVDVLVVAAARARLSAVLPGPAETARALRLAERDTAWVIDVDARSVWLPAGDEIALASQPVLFKLLVALARADGVASASDLATGTWDLREYHALRDGNRLRVAVRRLRDRIGVDRIETVGDGYRLTGAVRVVARGAPR